MPVKLQIISTREIIRTRPEGDVDLEKAKQWISKIASIDRMPADHVILFDARSTSAKLSTTDVWELAMELDKHRSTYNSKTAVVVPKQDFDTARFLALCANNRGISFRAFMDYEESIDWLSTVHDLDV